MWRKLLAVLLSSIVGALCAFTTTAAASYSFRIDVLPPTNTLGNYSKLTSGWHYPGTGPALDFSNDPRDAFLRVIATKQSSHNKQLWIFPYSDISRGYCTVTRVDFYSVDPTEGTSIYGGTVNFTHVDKSNSFTAQQLPVNGTVTNNVVGLQKTSENPGCDWRGRHVHLQFDEQSPTGGTMPGSWARQISNDPKIPYVNDPDYTHEEKKQCKNDYCGDFKNNDPSNWAARTSW